MNQSTEQSNRIPVGVIGCGRMGKLHTRIYSQMPQVQLVGVYDANPALAQALATQFNCRAFDRLEDLIPLVKAVTIAVPTQYHATTAEPCLKQGVACLIEKPLARNIAEGKQIVEWAKKYNATVQVGHVERFNPAVRAMRQFKLQPQFIEAIRVSPLTFRSIDVGVVLDMMIHDLDIVLGLAQSTVTDVQASGVSVIGQVEDICSARVTFANGCVANITGSRLALKTERKLRVFCPDAFVSLDYQKKECVIVRRDGNLNKIQEIATQIRTGHLTDLSQVNYTNLVNVETLPIDDVEPLRAEQDAFIDAVKNKTRPIVNAEDGLAAVELATRIVAAMGSRSL